MERCMSILLALVLVQATSIAGQQCQIPFHWMGQWWLGYIKTPTGHAMVYEKFGPTGHLEDVTVEKGQAPTSAAVTCLSYDETQSPPYKFFTRRLVGAPVSEVYCVQNLQIGNLLLQRSEKADQSVYANQCPGFFNPPSDEDLMVLLKQPFDGSLGQCVGATSGMNSPQRAKMPTGHYQATVYVDQQGDIRCSGDYTSYAIVTETGIELHTCMKHGDYYWPTSGVLHCAGSFDTSLYGDVTQGSNGYIMIFTREDNGKTYIYCARFAMDPSGRVIDISISIKNQYQASCDLDKNYQYVEQDKFIKITLRLEDCTTKTCNNGGSCVENNGKYECMCPPGFYGPMCQTNTDSCSPNPCSNYRTRCVADGMGNPQCVCDKGYSGPNCENQSLPDQLTYYILGGVLGGLLALILLIICCCCCCRDEKGASKWKRMRQRKHGILVEKEGSAIVEPSSASSMTVGPASTIVTPAANRGMSQQTYAVGGTSVVNAPTTAASNPTTVTLLLQPGAKPQVTTTQAPVVQQVQQVAQVPQVVQVPQAVRPVPITQALYPNLNGYAIRGNMTSPTGTIHMPANGYR